MLGAHKHPARAAGVVIMDERFRLCGVHVPAVAPTIRRVCVLAVGGIREGVKAIPFKIICTLHVRHSLWIVENYRRQGWSLALPEAQPSQARPLAPQRDNPRACDRGP